MADPTSTDKPVEEKNQEQPADNKPATPPQSTEAIKPTTDTANGEKPTEQTQNSPQPTESTEQKKETPAVPPPASPPAGTPPPSQEEKPLAQPQQKKFLSRKRLIIIGALLVVGLSALFAVLLASNSGTSTKIETTNKTVDSELKPTTIQQKDKTGTDINNPQAFSRMLVYGSWSGQTSLIKAVELSNQSTKLLATLPSSIKKVSILSPETIVYIDETDKRDHGKKIVLYNIKSKSPEGSILADKDFGIDDYVLSPDKRYVAIWEVSFAKNTEILMGGKSRVYAVDLKRPSVKNLLYDETATLSTPVHYPRAILNNGKVFADKFTPNDPKGGAGWAYGLSVVEFDGTNKQDLQQMQHGSYGTQPSLSPDGKYLLFSGYDGSRGDGKSLNGGYRQAILTPNTVELLDTQTYNRQKLTNLENSNIYSSSEWDTSSGKIVLTIISREPEKSGIYTYDVSKKEPVKLSIPSTATATYGFLTEVTENTTIIGNQDTNASNLGNLGEGYAFPFTQIALMDKASLKVNFVKLDDTFAQYITLLPGNYFDNVLGIQANAQTLPKPTFVDMYSSQNEQKANQQLYTFIVKYDLLKTRLNQQSNPLIGLTQVSGVPISGIPGIPKDNDDAPTCEQIAEQQCQQQGLSEASGETYEDCVKTNKNQNKLQKSSGLCSDSPLYLYGPEGLDVTVQIQTPVYNAIPAYKDGYNITLGSNGIMKINGKAHTSIAYDYQNNSRKIQQPKFGTVVEKSQIEKVLREYAAKLGLNKKEAQDLISAGKQKITAEYAFISFFDQETSEQILPISFNPEPDNYLNVVFYFKNLEEKPKYTPLPPVFPTPIIRTGFTAVEISEMVE